MTEFEKTILALHQAGKPFVLAVITGSSGSMPRRRGARMAVWQDGKTAGTVGGGALEAQVIAHAMTVLETKQGKNISFALDNRQAALSEMICGGSGEISLQYFPPESDIKPLFKAESTLFIFGGGHISCALAKGAALLELPTVVLDDRAEYANQERFPQSECKVLKSFADIPPLELGRRDMAVIVTRGHLGDVDVLRWAVRQDIGYIGMIGSRRKRDMVYTLLKEEGVAHARLLGVHAPIGLDIGAETPGEIAVSILAELVKVRADWDREVRQ